MIIVNRDRYETFEKFFFSQTSSFPNCHNFILINIETKEEGSRGWGKGNPKGESNGNRMKRFAVEDMTFGALRILGRSGTAINRQKEVEEQPWDTFHPRNFVFAPVSTSPFPPFSRYKVPISG